MGKFDTEVYRSYNAQKKRERYNANDEVKEYEHKRRRGAEQRYAKVKHKAKKAGEADFSITFEDYKNLIESRCFYCNSDLTGEAGMGIDRSNYQAGYTIDNVRPCCSACSRRRNRLMDATTFREQSILNGYWKE